MNRQKINYYLGLINKYPAIVYLFKWLLLSAIVGVLAGSASALFLFSLDWVTNFREHNFWIIGLLPLAGFIVGITYHYYGTNVVKGNNQLIEEIYSPKKITPFRMAPLVLFGTLVTHLFGGSAGREGTALQMGGAIADQFSKIFKLTNNDRKIILIIGISAGFASVFGTPIAGAVFALEVIVFSRMNYNAIIPCFLTAFIADFACTAWNIHHVHYQIAEVPFLSPQNIFWSVLAGIAFGLTALLFSIVVHYLGNAFKKYISYAPFRPLTSGVVIVFAVWIIGNTDYIGLGVPVIQKAFIEQLNYYDFLAKLLFTTFTLGAGFKGGEVTPLFYIGATLGNALAWIIPLPIGLLAGMGFVAIFSGATNAPVACTLMGMELFGLESGIYIALACTIAYLFSGNKGIYTAQGKNNTKQSIYALLNKSIAKLKY
jgi:H+/Cl- antiporter ClcA